MASRRGKTLGSYGHNPLPPLPPGYTTGRPSNRKGMTLAGSKRSATQSHESIQNAMFQEATTQDAASLMAQNIPSDGSFVQVICAKLQSQQKDKVIAACGLLAALGLPLQQVLASNAASSLLPSLLTHIGAPDTTISAEAASILRAWSTDVDKVRLLYAYCVFPKILALLTDALARLKGVANLSPDGLLLLEHWLTSLLLFCWAVVEEIPASLPQINKSALAEISIEVLQGGSKWWSQEMLIIVSRMLLCVCEDNSAFCSDVQAVRLEALLSQNYLSPTLATPPHLKVLAAGIIKTLRGSTSQVNDIVFLSESLSKVEELNDASLELLLDLLEMLANLFSEEVEQMVSPNPLLDCCQNLCKLFESIVTEETLVSKWHSCLQRIISCLTNLASWSCIPDAEKQTLWGWATSTALPLAIASGSIDLLASCSELLRILVLQSLGKYALSYSTDEDERLRNLCTEFVENDQIIANLLPIVAIQSFRTGSANATWFGPFIKHLFVESKAGKVILAVAEVVEELSGDDGLDLDAVQHLAGHQRVVYKACQSIPMEGDELEYITNVIDSALETRMNQ